MSHCLGCDGYTGRNIERGQPIPCSGCGHEAEIARLTEKLTELTQENHAILYKLELYADGTDPSTKCLHDIIDILGAHLAAERKACAEIARAWIGPEGKDLDDGDAGLFQDGRNNAARGIAAAIRARETP